MSKSITLFDDGELFARLLDVDVRRLSTIAAGAHVCTTHVPLGRPGSGACAPPAPQTTDQPNQPRSQRG